MQKKILHYFLIMFIMTTKINAQATGINTTDPTATLDVNGEARFRDLLDGSDKTTYTKTLVIDGTTNELKDGGYNSEGYVYFDILSPLNIFFWNTDQENRGYDLIKQSITTVKTDQILDLNLHLPFRLSSYAGTKVDANNGTPLPFESSTKIIKTYIYIDKNGYSRKLVAAKTQYISGGFKETALFGTNIHSNIKIDNIGTYDIIVRVETNCINGEQFRINYKPVTVGKTNYFKITAIN